MNSAVAELEELLISLNYQIFKDSKFAYIPDATIYQILMALDLQLQ